MTITKRKKVILISGIALILVAAILLSLYWFVWREDEEPEEPVVIVPVETSTLFVMPDEVIFIKGEKTQALEQEQIAAIYEHLARWEALAFDTAVTNAASVYLTNKISSGELCMELHYRHPLKYNGKLSAFCGEEYDTIRILMMDGPSRVVMPLMDGKQPSGGCCTLSFYNEQTDESLAAEGNTVFESIKSFYTP